MIIIKQFVEVSFRQLRALRVRATFEQVFGLLLKPGFHQKANITKANISAGNIRRRIDFSLRATNYVLTKDTDDEDATEFSYFACACTCVAIENQALYWPSAGIPLNRWTCHSAVILIRSASLGSLENKAMQILGS